MDVYVYRADLYCAPCIEGNSDLHCRRPDSSCATNCGDAGQNFAEGCDSDCCPQGPYPHGGGESDYPQYCAECDVPLENPVVAAEGTLP